MAIGSYTQKELQAFLERRHPEYVEYLNHWNFLEDTYEGGREWFKNNLFRYIKEGDKEYADRVARAYRFNHTREVVDLVQKYIFKSPVARNEQDAPEEISNFWKNVTLSGLDITQFMRLTCNLSSIYGRIWVFMDTNKTANVISLADEKAAKSRVYAYFVTPQNVLDMGYSETGDLLWTLVRETIRDDKDPILSSGEIKERFRLWTKEEWVLFEVLTDARTKKKTVAIVDRGPVTIGMVPGFPVDNIIGEDRYCAPALIADIAYLDRAVGNYLSNLDAIIQDQTFSQLAMPAQNLMPGEDKYEKLLEMGTKRVFLFDGEGSIPPFYLSPDVKQAEIIVTVVNKIINEIYHTVGMAGERTKQDNAVGIDNSSGVAKAYDFERLNSLLTTKAGSLENAENTLIKLVCAYSKITPPDEELVKYPQTFDVRSLFDEFTVSQHLLLIDAPEDVRREQMKQVIDKLFPVLAVDLKKSMLTALEKWPPDPMELASATNPPSKFAGSPANRNPQTAKRQGQVTATTGKS